MASTHVLFVHAPHIFYNFFKNVLLKSLFIRNFCLIFQNLKNFANRLWTLNLLAINVKLWHISSTTIWKVRVQSALFETSLQHSIWTKVIGMFVFQCHRLRYGLFSTQAMALCTSAFCYFEFEFGWLRIRLSIHFISALWIFLIGRIHCLLFWRQLSFESKWF